MNLSHSPHLKYRAYVDGLRAVAVLPVLFFHANLGCTGGYVGVDIFFVISGYLITGLILKDLDVGQFHIVKFWERRVRRILPAVAVVMLATLVAGWFLLLPQGFKELGESATAQTLLVSNIYFWVKSWIGAGYFAPAAQVKPLLHTWSLAVEEQFYLFFPFLLIAFKRFSHKSIVPAIMLFGGVSFGFSVYCSYFYPAVNFYFLPPRAWELLLGAYLAAIPVQSRASARWLTESLSWGGLLAILCAAFCYDRETRFPGAAALLPCVGTALILWANGYTLTSVGKFLALRPIVFIGLISYSLYLWHWPVLVFYKYWAIDPVPPGQRLLLLLASVGLAVLSWKFVETPFRQRVILKTRSQIFSFAGVTTAVLLFAGLAVFISHGLPSRLPADALRYANISPDLVFKKELSLKQALAGDLFELRTSNKQQPIKLLVWGDSHAMAVMPVFDTLCEEHAIRGVAATHAGTTPLVGFEDNNPSSLREECIPYNNAVVDFIRKRRVRDVILVARWGGKETWQLRRCLLATLDILKGSCTRIWVMRDVPIQRWNVPDALASAIWHGDDPEKLGLPLAEYRAEFQHQDPVFQGLTRLFPQVTVLDPTDLFVSTNNLCRVESGGKALYCDKDHLTVAGAMLLRPLFEPIFANMSEVTNAHR
jgi:peptidoglycan/LPS O-acetylase OafA/YrhL